MGSIWEDRPRRQPDRGNGRGNENSGKGWDCWMASAFVFVALPLGVVTGFGLWLFG